jgi:hypothetical protein
MLPCLKKKDKDEDGVKVREGGERRRGAKFATYLYWLRKLLT